MFCVPSLNRTSPRLSPKKKAKSVFGFELSSDSEEMEEEDKDDDDEDKAGTKKASRQKGMSPKYSGKVSSRTDRPCVRATALIYTTSLLSHLYFVPSQCCTPLIPQSIL